jgi:TolB-like protein
VGRGKGEGKKEVTQMKLTRILMLLFLILILITPSISTPQTRDPGKVYKVAILPFLINSQENLDYLREGIYDILSSRITVDGKIMVVERSLVEQALYEERPMRLDETVATKIGMRVGADYVILGSLTKIGNYFSLDARVLSITEEKPPLGVYTQDKGIDDVMVKIGDFAQEIGSKILGRRPMVGRPTEPKQPYIIRPRNDIGRIGSEDLGIKKSQTFDFEIKGLGIGDVDGDGKNELVVMDNYNLYVFKYTGEKLSLFQKIGAGYEYNFLTLDVADINRNGYAEIIVTAVVENNLRSFILESEEGRFKKITENTNWCFRVLEHPKDGPILIGQKMGTGGEISGSIYRLVWKKNSFKKGPKMPFPKGTKIFGLAMGEIRNQGAPELIGIDDFGRLRIITKNRKSSWTSREHFGGTINFYDIEAKKNLMTATRSTLGADWRVYIPGRILVKDFAGNGLDEVIVNKNISSTTNLVEKLKFFEKGEIYSLVWDGDVLTTNWKTKQINGYISDFQIKDVDNDGDEELVVAVIDLGSITTRKGVSHILFFKLF